MHSYELSSNPGVSETFEFIKSCLKSCDDDHIRCRRNVSSRLPTRLIDVLQPNSSYVRLVETASRPNEPYIALSYCWGTGENKKTTIVNYKEMLKFIQVVDLPATLQDAIFVTRRLGLRYLWIDAICIIQDSFDDWARESAMMASVYRNAYLTIAAGSASAASEGFLQRRHFAGAQLPPFRTDWRTASGTGTVLAARIVPGRESHAHDSDEQELPLDQRGWCLQERELSTRTLTYTELELYWTCMCSTTCECHTRDQFPRTGSGSGRDVVAFTSIFEITANEAREKWIFIVESYALRALTNRMDTLPAIAGVASVIQELTGSKYIAGLWQDDIVLGLAWEFADHSFSELDNLPCQPEKYIAPTFSWASVIGGFAYTRASRYHMSPMRWVSGCEALDSGSVVRGPNPLGPVDSGFVNLKGRISVAKLLKGIDEKYKKMWHVELQGKTMSVGLDARLEEFSYLSEDGHTATSVRRSAFKSKQEVIKSGVKVYLFYIGSWEGGGRYTKSNAPCWEHVFLVLGRSPDTLHAFTRLGLSLLIELENPEIDNLAKWEQVEITIV